MGARRLSEASALLAQWKTSPFALIVVDERLPDGSGLTLVSAARELVPRPDVIVVTGALRQALAHELRRHGVFALQKPVSHLRLIASCDGAGADLLADGDPISAFSGAANLSERERTVLGHLLAGHSRAEAADLMGIAAPSVDSYVRRICDKTETATWEAFLLRLVAHLAANRSRLQSPPGALRRDDHATPNRQKLPDVEIL